MNLLSKTTFKEIFNLILITATAYSSNICSLYCVFLVYTLYIVINVYCLLCLHLVVHTAMLQRLVTEHFMVHLSTSVLLYIVKLNSSCAPQN